MGILKKCAAATLWTTTATAFVGVEIAKSIFDAAAKKVGDGSFTSSSGNTYTGSDYRDASGKCSSCEDGILKAGFKKAKEMWNE